MAILWTPRLYVIVAIILVALAGSAYSQSDLEKVKRMLDARPDMLNAKHAEQGGQTMLHYAVWHNQRDVVEYLLSRGADVNARDDNAATPLHVAAWKGHAEVAEMLLAKGADVNSKESDGATPLRLAIVNKQSNVANVLRRRGGHE